jgi:hypothetical protein
MRTFRRRSYQYLCQNVQCFGTSTCLILKIKDLQRKDFAVAYKDDLPGGLIMTPCLAHSCYDHASILGLALYHVTRG